MSSKTRQRNPTLSRKADKAHDSAKKLSFAQVPYKVRTQGQFHGLKDSSHCSENVSINSNSARIDLPSTVKNPYDLIACGDYNTFAVLSL